MFGADAPLLKEKRVVTVQALGGTGGLKIGADFLKQLAPDAQVWISEPSWENHRALFEAAGFRVQAYPYYDPATRGLKFEAMQQILSNTTKVIVDQKGGQNLLYLPLDKLMQMTSQQGATVSAQGSDQPLPRMVSPAETPAAAPAAADTRGRDALRSRDR